MTSHLVHFHRLALAAAVWLAAGSGDAAAAKEQTRPPINGVATAQQLSDAFAAVAERVQPSVVTIYSEKIVKFRHPYFSFPFGEDWPFRRFFGEEDPRRPMPPPREREHRQQGLGSGIILDKKGFILTNNHVIDDVDEIKVTLADKRSFAAEVVGADPLTDLAIIRIKDTVPDDLPVATLGTSETARVGDWVLAIGAPFGYERTITAGIISAKGRAGVEAPTNGVAPFEDFLQTDAAINPGNSGGPLVNIHGEVIGINTAIATRVGQFSGVGFAIPIDMARRLMPTLMKGEKVRRGLLGVIIQELNSDLADQFGLADARGALVAQVNPGSAAAKAGIEAGDVITEYNGQPVASTSHLRNLVASTAPGEKAKVVVVRDGKVKTFTVTVGELTPEGMAGDGSSESDDEVADLGMTVEPVSPATAKQFGLAVDEQGIVVTALDSDGAAARADIRVGDLIAEVNRQPVRTAGEFRAALARVADKDTVLLLVKSGRMSRFVIVPLK